MTFLFIATIGPVQPLIASARRTRDLYAGSTLVSELSKAAASKIVERVGQQNLVFPAPQGKNALVTNSSFNVANKLVAVVVVEDPETVKALGEEVRQAIQDRLKQVREHAFSIQKKEDGKPGEIELTTEAQANAQLENLVEYSWVAVPYAQKSEYANARKNAEALLSMRKNTHTFGPVTWGNNQEKSSIDGQRECVIPSKYYSGNQNTAKQLYDRYKAGPHEHLSAVDLLKRLYDEKPLTNEEPETVSNVVLSTSHIAATPFLRQLNALNTDRQQQARVKWANYIEKVRALVPPSSEDHVTSPILEKLPLAQGLTILAEKYLENDVTGCYDGALLFEERLLDDAVNIGEFKHAKSALQDFFTCVGMRPSPYYALLLADGDGMGKAIDAHAESVDGHAQHQRLSLALSGFSGKVAAIVQKHYGSLIYAGGDDVMALLPLDKVLECTHILAEEFSTALSTFKYLEKETQKEKAPTLSAGIAVIHHVSLLDEALALARASEHRAKAQKQKNSLAITIRKRSGEDYPLVVSWKKEADAQSQNSPMEYAQLQDLITLYSKNRIPKGTAYELRAMVQRLEPAPGTEQSETLQKIMQIDAARILRRKVQLSGRSDANGTNGTDTTFMDLLPLIGVEKDTIEAFKVVQKVDLKQFINALIVAQAFSETTQEQKGKDAANEQE